MLCASGMLEAWVQDCNGPPSRLDGPGGNTSYLGAWWSARLTVMVPYLLMSRWQRGVTHKRQGLNVSLEFLTRPGQPMVGRVVSALAGKPTCGKSDGEGGKG